MKIKYFFTPRSLSTLGSSSLLNLNMIVQMTVNRVGKGLNSWIYSSALQPGLKSSHSSEFTSVTELFVLEGTSGGHLGKGSRFNVFFISF